MKRINLNFKIKEFLKFEFAFEFVLEKMICDEIRFKNNEIYIIRRLKIIKINGVEEIKRVLKSKNFSLIINFDNDSM